MYMKKIKKSKNYLKVISQIEIIRKKKQCKLDEYTSHRI